MESKQPITLCDLLGLNMDSRVGMIKVGRLPPSEVEFLHQASPANPFSGGHCDQASPDDEFNPVPASERNCCFSSFCEIQYRDAEGLVTSDLQAMLPRLSDIEELRFTYLKCDYIALHHDRIMKGFDHLHSMAILLAAPRGCNLVTGGDHQTLLAPGDVVIINDQVKHGAYPVEKPESTAQCALVAISPEDRIGFVDRNCLSFLLICAAQPY